MLFSIEFNSFPELKNKLLDAFASLNGVPAIENPEGPTLAQVLSGEIPPKLNINPDFTKRRPGRPPGPPKEPAPLSPELQLLEPNPNRVPISEEMLEAATKATYTEPPAPVPLTIEDTRAALQKVLTKKGADTARRLLTEFGAVRIPDLKAAQYESFIDSCKKAVKAP